MPESKGLINVYQCEVCGRDTVTVNLADGVTPMFLRCRAGGIFKPCQGTAASMGYRVPQDLVPAYGWYSPDEAQREKLDPDTRDHVENDGLLLRALDAIERLQHGAPSPRSDGS